jgi:hypothetical protein
MDATAVRLVHEIAISHYILHRHDDDAFNCNGHRDAITAIITKNICKQLSVLRWRSNMYSPFQINLKGIVEQN